MVKFIFSITVLFIILYTYIKQVLCISEDKLYFLIIGTFLFLYLLGIIANVIVAYTRFSGGGNIQNG